MIPEGRHRAKIEKVQYHDDNGHMMHDKNGCAMVKLVVKVQGYEKKELWVWLIDNEYLNRKLGGILESTELIDYIDETFKVGQLQGQTGYVMIRHVDYAGNSPKMKGKKVEDIHYWISPDEISETKSPSAVGSSENGGAVHQSQEASHYPEATHPEPENPYDDVPF